MAKAKLNSLVNTINGSVDGLNVYQKGGATITATALTPLLGK